MIDTDAIKAQLGTITSTRLPLDWDAEEFERWCVDNLRALIAEVERLRGEVKLLTHQIITCGVAAGHPDPNLSRTGIYATEWDSPQANEVRALRDDRDTLKAEVERLKAVETAHEAVVVRCRTTPGQCFCGCHISQTMEPRPL